jgi:hypothetical protein
LAPPSRTPRRNPSCSGPPPRPARRSRRKPRPGKKPSEKSRLFLTLGRSTAASRVFFYLGHVRLLPQALRGVHGRRCLEPSQCSCCTAGEGRSGRKRQVLGRRKNQETRFAMRGAGVTYLPGRTRRRRAASRPRAQRWRARRRRPHEPSGQSARRGGLADAAANTRKAREEMEEQEPGPLSALCRRSWFRPSGGWGSNENREAHRVAGSRRQVLCSPIRATDTCRGYTWRASGALIARGELSCCAVAASAVCGGPRSRDGGGAARGFLALAASERRAAVLSPR